MNRKQFLGLLFNAKEQTCFTDNPKGYRLKPKPAEGDCFFCINPLHPTEDIAPIKEWHAPNKPRRADANVIVLRNFLIEIDDLPLQAQIDYVRSKIPVSAITYSGGKSYHFIISLQEPCEDYNDYMDMAKRIEKLIPKLDRQCKNPSRLSRLPEAIRPENGAKQELVYLGKRVDRASLETLLPKVAKHVTITPVANGEGGKVFLSTQVMNAIAEPKAMVQYLEGRNSYFHWLGNRLKEIPNMTEDKMLKYVNKAYERLPDSQGFAIEEAHQAARIRS